ncbi:Eukaryotic translation initiation factor 2-alpha kinase [Irineochytrium annulatum]|nr:Eukaryotic translation initiation factor 2-alpha kinase [Irineochytrium annulatum]
MSAREGFRRVGSGLRREMTPPTPSDISIEFLSDAAVGTSFVEKDDEEEEDDDDDENDEDDDEDSDADDEDNDADDSEGEGPLTIGSFKTNTTESVSLHTIRRARSTTDYETASASSASEAAPIRGALMTRLNGTRKSKSSRRSEDSKLQRDLTLFIQMELCGATLQEYLLARNRSLFSKTNFSATSLSHPAPDLEIFRDVCEGLAYLHSQNCIHRDIAPKNLFWVPDDDGSSFEITSQNGTSPGCGFWWWETDASSLRRRRGHWKIGDFGLVTTALASDPLGDAASTTTAAPSTLDQESLSFVEPPLAGSVTPPRKDSFQSDISSSPLAGTIMTAGVHLANLRSQRRSSSINSGDHSHFHHHHGIKPQTTLVDMEAAAVDTQNAASGSHNTTSNGRTTGVGTVTYASPEQLNPNPSVPYTSSSDLYSLGIVLFELLHPFSTGMERAERLTALRGSGAMPDAFVRAWPKEATLVLWLMSEDPTKRPTAREVLELEWWDTETGADTAEAGAEALKRRASWSMPEVGGTPSKATLEGRIMRSRSSGLPNAAGVGLQVRTSSATIATQTDAPPGSAGGRIVSGGISLRVPGILSPVASATPGRSRAASVTVGTGMEEDAEANARSGAASAAGSSANTSPSMPRDHHHHHHVDGKKPGVVKRIAAVFAHVADSIVHPSHREDKEKSGGVDEDAVTAGPKESGGGRGEDAKKAWEEVDALTRRVRELEEKVKSLGGVVD